MERIKEILRGIVGVNVTDPSQPICDGNKLVNDADKEITTYIIGEVRKLKRYDLIYGGYDEDANGIFYLVDDVEKMLKGEIWVKTITDIALTAVLW